MGSLRSIAFLCALLACAGCRTQLLADGGTVPDGPVNDGAISDGSSARDLPLPIDEGPAFDLGGGGPRARPGLPCGGGQCGADAFCVISDANGGQPRCERVPNCLKQPTCDCFTGPNSTSLDCYGAMCIIDQTGDVLCKH